MKRCLQYRNDSDNIKLTAAYGGQFDERRIFDAAIPKFLFPETSRYGKSTMATLRIDQTTYEGKASSLDDALDYLVPRPGNIWRHAMNAFPTEKEETVVVALTGACQANDDKWFMSAAQDGQCKNLVERFPVDAKKFVFKQGFVGKEGGPYSKRANGPPGPKD